MPWLCFGLALGCFVIAMRTQSIGLALLCLLAALGLMLWGALSLVSARIQSRAQSGMGLNPVLERQRLKAQAGGADRESAEAAVSGETPSTETDTPDQDDDGPAEPSRQPH